MFTFWIKFWSTLPVGLFFLSFNSYSIVYRWVALVMQPIELKRTCMAAWRQTLGPDSRARLSGQTLGLDSLGCQCIRIATADQASRGWWYCRQSNVFCSRKFWEDPRRFSSFPIRTDSRLSNWKFQFLPIVNQWDAPGDSQYAFHCYQFQLLHACSQ